MSKKKSIMIIIFTTKHLNLMLKNDFLEITLKMLLEYAYIDKSCFVIAAFKLINDNKEEMYVATYLNGDNIFYKNFVFLNKSIFYNFKKDTKKYEY